MVNLVVTLTTLFVVVEYEMTNKNLYCLVSSVNPLLSESVVNSCEKYLQQFCEGFSDLQNSLVIRFFSRILKRGQLIFSVRFLQSNRAYIAVMMGVGRSYRLFPICYANEIIPYCYDCWPFSWPDWQKFLEMGNIKVAFFTSRQSCEHFSKLNPQISCNWLPEATNVNDYVPSCPLTDRRIDVLEMGRKHPTYHNSISDLLLQSGYVHLYEINPGEIIFSTTQLLVEGLADSKISICFPASITHPEKSQGVETVTHRYFESMASKCVILGKCPSELIELFGYNPVIEVDAVNPSEQIVNILANIGSYQELVDKNYNRLLEVGTWEVRTKEMINILVNEYGYQLTLKP